jgi:AraC-like DNA-binding protein
VAGEAGFHDQAHLTRRFKRFLGVTPGAFAPPSVAGRRCDRLALVNAG